MLASFHLVRYGTARDGMPHMAFDRPELRRTPGPVYRRLTASALTLAIWSGRSSARVPAALIARLPAPPPA